MSAELKQLEPELADAEATLNALLAATPNLPDDSAPDGGEDDAVEIKRNHDRPPAFDFEVRDHVALGELLGVLDIDRGVRTSGSRFVYLLGDIVLAAVRARAQRHGHPDAGGLHPGDPAGARARGGHVRHGVPARRGGQHLPDRRGRPVPGRHRGGAARRAAHGRDHRRGAAARCDTRATRRASAARPAATARTSAACSACTSSTRSRCSCSRRRSQSAEAHEFLLARRGDGSSGSSRSRIASSTSRSATSVLPAAKKYDIEGWLPGQQRYRELTSCSNTTDYQARRLQTRVRRADGSLETLHTLNGTATAIGRTLIAILENHQRADGSRRDPRAPVAVPAGACAGVGADGLRRAARPAPRRSVQRRAGCSRHVQVRHVDRDAVPELRGLVLRGMRAGRCAWSQRTEPSRRDHPVRVVPVAVALCSGHPATTRSRSSGCTQPFEVLGLGQELGSAVKPRTRRDVR